MRRCTISLVGWSRQRFADETKSCGGHTKKTTRNTSNGMAKIAVVPADATEKWSKMECEKFRRQQIYHNFAFSH